MSLQTRSPNVLEVQGWFYEAPGKRGKPAPTVVEIHGGPATLYGFSLFWEWQVMLGRGKPDTMGYADDELYKRKDAHLKTV